MILNPKNFGAKGDGVNDDAPSWQAMFNSINTSTDREIWIEVDPVSIFLFGSTVEYPIYNDREYFLYGKGSIIKAVGNNFDLLRPGLLLKADGSLIPFKGSKLSNDEALFGQHKWVVRDLKFRGGKTQFTTASTFKNDLRNVEFYFGEVGYKGIFSLGGVIDNCHFNSYTQEGLVLTSGQADDVTGEEAYWVNASATNSQSNVWTIRDSRFFIGKPNTRNCLRVRATNSIKLINCIMEGIPCKHIVDYDTKGSVTVTAFDVEGLHVEMNITNDPTSPNYNLDDIESLFKLRQDGGMIRLSGVYSQVGQVVQVDNLGGCILKLENWRYIPGGAKFKGSKGRWIFENCYGLDSELLSYWADTNYPPYVARISALSQEGVRGWSPVMKYGSSMLALQAGKISMNIDSIMNTNNKEYTTPKELNAYELRDGITYVEKDATGNQVVNIIPIIRLK